MGMGGRAKGEEAKTSGNASTSAEKPGVSRWASAFGLSRGEEGKKKEAEDDDEEDRKIRFTIGGVGRRMTKEDFIEEMKKLDKSTRRDVVNHSTASEAVKTIANQAPQQAAASPALPSGISRRDYATEPGSTAPPARQDSGSGSSKSSPRPASVEGGSSLSRQPSNDIGETEIERRRRLAVLQSFDGPGEEEDAGETAAERRRREAALGMASPGLEEDSDDDDTPRVPPAKRPAIRFAEPDRGRST